MATTPYLDATAANTYFSTERLVTAAWTAATSGQQNAALVEATRIIDRQNLAGYKAVDTQANQFPRGGDTVVPQDILDACCEIAYALLDAVDPDLEIENATYNSQGVGEARVSRNTGYVQDHILHGVPSIRAWAMLKPYLRDDRQVHLDRV